MTSRWAQAVAEVALELDCSGETHRLRWHAGRVSADAHPDIDAEAALAAFGGDLPRCIELVQHWRNAVRDGGFVAEWCDSDLDDPVARHRLGIAVNRLSLEGVQDLMPTLAARRAEAMGQFLVRFPQRWVDRAALGVIRGARTRPANDPVAVAIRRAVQVRARSSFVRSLARWSAVVRPAALVRFECVVTPWDTPALATGVLDGPASWCRLSLSPRWLVEVWGPGRTLDNAGDLVLDVTGSCLRWERSAGGRLTACVRPAPA